MKREFRIAVKNSFTPQNESLCELYFMDVIADKEHYDWVSNEIVTDSLLKEVIDQVNAANPTKIVQHIDSWGGSAPVGLGIYNFLKNHKAEVHTNILNNAASIASVMAQAADKGNRKMPKHGMMVIHQASNSAQGTSAVLREAADVADKYTDTVCDIYAQHNTKGMTKDEIYNLIKDGDYWMTGAEAKELGFIDDCYNDVDSNVTNNIAIAKTIYNNIPQRILDMESAPDDIKSLKNFFMQFKDKVTAFMDKFKTADVSANAKPAVQEIVNSFKAPLEEMAEGLQNEVAEEITNRVTEVENKITAAYECKITELTNLINAQAATLKTQSEQIEALTNEVAEVKGAGTSGASKEDDKPKGFTLKVK